MIRTTVTINSEGLEARPIAMLVQKACKYSSRVHIEVGSKTVNAKSIMGMMSLGLAAGEEITIVADGDDEKKAVSHIEEYLSEKKAC